MNINLVDIPTPENIKPYKDKVDFGPASGTWIAKVISEGGVQSYEPPTLAAIMALMEYHGKKVHFVDVGANIFVYPLVARAIFGLDPVISAFEPHPSLVRIGLQLIKKNNLPFDVVGKAVSEYNGEGTLYLSAKSDTSNSLVKGFREELGEISVEIVSLDSYFGDHMVGPLIIKIDTETNEPDVLRGADLTIKNHRPWIICEVLYGLTENKIMEAMGKHGYSFYSLSEDRDETWTPREEIVGDKKYIHRDWLFAPKEVDVSIKDGYDRWIAALSG